MYSAASLPPLSLSILGVEPLDEFIREIADFIHHMIVNRPDFTGQVEVEAKIGILRDKNSGKRLELPVLVETSMFARSYHFPVISSTRTVLRPETIYCRFESNMSVVCAPVTSLRPTSLFQA